MNRLMSRFYDRFMNNVETSGLKAWRAELLGGLHGDVLEIGAGTGANLPHYPDTVARLVLSEPSIGMRAQLQRRADDHDREVEVQPWGVDDIECADGSFDAVVSTLVLCSVPNLTDALRHVGRLLKPGGELRFMEHVAAHDHPGRLRWQKIVEPFWRPVSGNCHLTRRTAEAIEAAGFEFATMERAAMPNAMSLVRPTVRGRAIWRG